MQAFCITLDENSPVRAVPAMREIQRLGFKGSFTSGVDVKQRSLDEFKEILSTRAYRELLEGRQVPEALSGLGSLGCYLAHYQLWQRCARGDQPIAVFEDDVQFTADTPQRLPALLRCRQ